MKKIIILSVLFFNLLFFENSSFSKINIKAKSIILQDYLSGEILFEKEADLSIYPASMTKIMTSIVAFDLINKEELSLDDKFIISKKAWRLSNPNNSSMFIMLDDEITVYDLLQGIVIVSGNDACVALAEGIAGSEEAFAEMMTAKAIEIGMENTNFSNSTGLNDDNNYSTVRDILIMSNYLITNYPNYYKYFKEQKFTWDRTGGDPITQPNTNLPLLTKNKYVDGIKTGFLSSEKYSLASSIKKNNRRMISVGSGFKTKAMRASESNKLLNYGLNQFDTIKIVKKNEIFSDLKVWHGTKDKVSIYLNQDVYKTIPKRKKKYLKVKINYNGPIKAPIEKNEIVGKLNIYFKDENIGTYDLLASENIKRQNIFSRLLTSINYLIWGDV
jgi:D-alanyl-D-alanine carboxypeptidase (penicillin-binding protein 5/6)